MNMYKMSFEINTYLLVHHLHRNQEYFTDSHLIGWMTIKCVKIASKKFEGDQASSRNTLTEQLDTPESSIAYFGKAPQILKAGKSTDALHKAHFYPWSNVSTFSLMNYF